MALVTIALLTYNRCDKLKDAINSVIGQDFTDWELIISDDNSKDDTYKVAQEYCDRDPRIKYVKWEGIGMTQNFIESMKLAHSKYFMWLCDDDWLGEGFLSACVQFLDKHPDYIECCGITNFVQDGKFIHADDILNFEQSDASERIKTYYQRVSSNVILYGLMRRDQIPAGIQYPDTYGADILFSSQIAYLGRVKTLDTIKFFYSQNGISQDGKKLAKYYGLTGRKYTNPYNKMKEEALRLIASDSDVFNDISKTRRRRLAYKCYFIIRTRFCLSPVESKLRASLKIKTRFHRLFKR